MDHFFTLFVSGMTSFFGHHFGERFLSKNRKRNVRLVLKGYQVHHSVFGLLAILAAFISAGYTTFALFGYGLGNIWQHKRTHNKVNEKGMVFITKHSENRTNLTP